VLGFVDIRLMRCTLVADQWAYFAIIAPIALLSAGMVLALRSLGPARTCLQPAVCVLLLAALGTLTWRQSRIYQTANSVWQATLAADPKSFLAYSAIGSLQFKSGDTKGAIQAYKNALAIEPDYFEAHHDLASIFDQLGRDAEAIAEYNETLQLNPRFLSGLNNLAWLLATSPQSSNRDGARAVTLARTAQELPGGDNASVTGTLAAAYAEAGRFPEAVAAAQKALTQAQSQKNNALVDELGGQLKLYQKGLPYRKPIHA